MGRVSAPLAPPVDADVRPVVPSPPVDAPRRRVTLRRRLATLLVVAGVVLGLVLCAAGLVFNRLSDRQDAVTGDIFHAVEATDAALLNLVDAETGLRGYALTGDPATLEPYERATSEDVSFEQIAKDLGSVVDDPELVALGRATDQRAQDWFTDYAEPLRQQVATSGPQSVTAQDVERGKASFDEVRAAASAFSSELRDLRTELRDEMRSATRQASILVGLLALAAIAVGIVLWTALRRWVVEPLDALAIDAREVADGDLTHPVVPQGHAEIADVAGAVESMRTTLLAQVEEVSDSHALLEQQTEELRRSNRDLEQFAYVASHDLQEPLRKVASFTQLLQKRYGGQMDERADQYIAFAVDGAKRMQRLIQDLLGFSRVGRVGGEVTDVPLEDALREALDNLSERIEEAGARVTHDELPVVRGEEPLLVQLFQNLVGNAIKFADPDRVPHVHVSARPVPDSGGSQWELRCRDNGIGIDAQYAERVFVIFQRLHPKDVYEGTGIGLALCKKIVEFHGGHIWIDPPEGEGTSIRWTLPAQVED